MAQWLHEEVSSWLDGPITSETLSGASSVRKVKRAVTRAQWHAPNMMKLQYAKLSCHLLVTVILVFAAFTTGHTIDNFIVRLARMASITIFLTDQGIIVYRLHSFIMKNSDVRGGFLQCTFVHFPDEPLHVDDASDETYCSTTRAR